MTEPLNLVTQTMLDTFVRSDPRRAQEIVPWLVQRLIYTTDQHPVQLDFPVQDSIGQRGPDGILVPSAPFDPFIPKMKSFWEIGTGADAHDKANRDYRKLTDALPAEVRRESAFIFVSPLSGVTEPWLAGEKDMWAKSHQDSGEWGFVGVLGGTQLISWMQHFPAVDRELALLIDAYRPGLATVSQHRTALRSTGDPPPLELSLFVKGRENAAKRSAEVLSGASRSLELRIETDEPPDFLDFVVAVLYSMTPTELEHIRGRCLIVEDEQSWRWVTSRRTPHVLIPTPELSLSEKWTTLLPLAKEHRHTVVYASARGGIPNWNSVVLPRPQESEIAEGLREIGYPPERARQLAARSAGSLQDLKAWLLNLATLPEWTQASEAAELRLAVLISEWRGDSPGDREAIEGFLGKSYGEWIGKLLPLTVRPGTPLIHRGERWEVRSKFRAWNALAQQITNEDLERFSTLATAVLGERDPRLDLDPADRMMASIRGIAARYSGRLREGIADTVALLGSHADVLTSCSPGKAEYTARVIVHDLLKKADWKQWASLRDVTPLLAEAAPEVFLEDLQAALRESSGALAREIFGQERAGIDGENFMTGVLWALETLAWSADYLCRVTVALGRLAELDPGGNWSNRPANSLMTIFLPWLPQTCASVAARRAAVQTLLKEHPDVGWNLLLRLLPRSHQISHGSRKPARRELIPAERSDTQTVREYREQVDAYASLAADVAQSDLKKLSELIERLPDVPPSARTRLLQHLSSQAVVSLPEADRYILWRALTALIRKHQKFADADWAMEPERISEIQAVALHLQPSSPGLRNRELFTTRLFDLIERKGDYDAQRAEIERRREQAVREVVEAVGLDGLSTFVKSVEAPWQVGSALGAVAASTMDTAILPRMLTSTDAAIAQFAAGFVRGRFFSKRWEWVDSIDAAHWESDAKAVFLSALPFGREAWVRARALLGDEEKEYWKRADANPYDAKTDLLEAVEKLLAFDRAASAIQLLEAAVSDSFEVPTELAIEALRQSLATTNSPNAVDQHATIQLIKWLQENPSTDPSRLSQIEWSYLPLLDRYSGASPKTLEKRLSTDPSFFAELIRSVFKSKTVAGATAEPTEAEKRVAENGYRLLQEWKTPPGRQPDGAFDPDATTQWVEEVKRLCAESGHLNVALSQIGHVLAYTPPDPDGLWITRGVAELLNAPDADRLRSGFTTSLFNERGVHGWTAGREELDLAAEYREKATAAEEAGYFRLAEAVREIARFYEAEAKRAAVSDPFEG